MMITVKCSSCNKELLVANVRLTVLNELIIDVTPCKNVDCYDCSKCEVEQEVKTLRKVIAEIKQTAESVTKKQEEPKEQEEPNE